MHLKGLREVPKLETAVLRDNGISVLTGLDKCPQLWRIDLANNRVRGESYRVLLGPYGFNRVAASLMEDLPLDVRCR